MHDVRVMRLFTALSGTDDAVLCPVTVLSFAEESVVEFGTTLRAYEVSELSHVVSFSLLQ